MILLSKLGDITRFESPRKLMAFLGITPSEHSSGGKEKRGGITDAIRASRALQHVDPVDSLERDGPRARAL